MLFVLIKNWIHWYEITEKTSQGRLWTCFTMRLKAEIPYFLIMKHLGIKSGNWISYGWKHWQHGFLGFEGKTWDVTDVSENCILTMAFSGEDSFEVLLWSNRMNGTQKMIHVGKMMPKVVEPTIENVEDGKIHFWSYCDLELVIWRNLVQMSFKTSKLFTFNNIIRIKSHLTSSS